MEESETGSLLSLLCDSTVVGVPSVLLGNEELCCRRNSHWGNTWGLIQIWIPGRWYMRQKSMFFVLNFGFLPPLCLRADMQVAVGLLLGTMVPVSLDRQSQLLWLCPEPWRLKELCTRSKTDASAPAIHVLSWIMTGPSVPIAWQTCSLSFVLAGRSLWVLDTCEVQHCYREWNSIYRSHFGEQLSQREKLNKWLEKKSIQKSSASAPTLTWLSPLFFFPPPFC